MFLLSKPCSILTFLGVSLLLLKSDCRGDSDVVQKPAAQNVREGDLFTMTCSYSTAFQPFYWYQQLPGSSLQHLLTVSSKKNSTRGRFTGERSADGKQSFLHLLGSQLHDSGIYWCANYRFIFGSGTKLHVEPNIEDSEPSVYKLKPRKGDNENLPACLITDYSPGNILAGLNGSLESVSSSFVITSYGASYGTVVWDDMPGNFSCSASHKGKTYSDLTEDADVPPVEEFETDERLNFISITVLGLRVIFLKSVAINLLLTFRLWSC